MTSAILGLRTTIYKVSDLIHCVHWQFVPTGPDVGTRGDD